MATRLKDLAQFVGGRLIGDGDCWIEDSATLRDAGPTCISFLESAEKVHLLAKTAACAVVVPLDVAPAGWPVIQVAEVKAAFAAIVKHFHPPRRAARGGINAAAHVSPSAIIAADVEIGPGATIGDDVTVATGCTIYSGVQIMAGCQLAENVTIFPNVVLYENTIVGPRSILHAGAVIGGYGFGYKLVDGRHQLSAQLGNVEIGADVEIGACSTIDRGTFGPTLIGDGTKIDNLVQIAHNCRIGKHNLICAQAGIAGSATLGDYVVLAGQVGVRDHVTVGERVVVGAQSGITQDVAEGSAMLGSPAIPERDKKVLLAVESKLPEMRRQLKEIRRQMEQLFPDAKQDPDEQAAA